MFVETDEKTQRYYRSDCEKSTGKEVHFCVIRPIEDKPIFAKSHVDIHAKIMKL